LEPVKAKQVIGRGENGKPVLPKTWVSPALIVAKDELVVPWGKLDRELNIKKLGTKAF